MRGIHWFRNDLRLRDHVALLALADRVEEWAPVFVLDPRLLDESLRRPRDRFLIECLRSLERELGERGVPLFTPKGRPELVLPRLMRRLGADVLTFNESDGLYAHRRDAEVVRACEEAGHSVLTFRDATVHPPEAIRTKTGGVYGVFTPYRRAWWTAWHDAPRLPTRLRLPARSIPVEPRASESALARLPAHDEPLLDRPTGSEAAGRRRLATFLARRVRDYATDRDRPAIDGTARISPYLRFGVLSPRQCVAAALEYAEAAPAARAGVERWLDEIVWREFYAMLRAHRPELTRENFRPEYDVLAWREDAEGFDAWCEGRTGYPIVDAGMRQLRATGWMHNRVRMIVASFLTKDLLIDWRRGARFFMDHLVDGDPASNSGGWQWSASTGTDAQPYFRIFNPTRQGERVDPHGDYVRRWVPELRDVAASDVHAPWLLDSPPRDYPAPIVDHASARIRALEVYRAARAVGSSNAATRSVR